MGQMSFLFYREKQEVRIIGDGYVLREFSYSDCESLAANANNSKIWNNLMDNWLIFIILPRFGKKKGLK